jgi:hypothetical protein
MKQPIYNGTNEDECEYYDVVQGEIEYNKMNKLKEKLKTNIKYHIDRIAETGSSSFSTCDYSGWDKDIWNHRHSIIDKLVSTGYRVESSVNHGVLDVVITANLEL